METESFENEFAFFYISDSILFYSYKQGVVINLAAAKRIVADRLEMQNERSFAVLCDISGVSDSDKPGRDYLAQYGSVLTNAVALLTNSKLLLVMTTFYLRVSKPQVPTRIFTDRSLAIEFLSGYL